MNKSTRIGLTGILLSFILAGCGSNVVMDAPTIPTPLIEKIPANVGLRIPAEFQDFVHEEEIIGREEWSIDLNDSNAALFEQLFGYMFEDVTMLGAEDDPKNFPIDALIEPSIDAFEFSVPNQSKTESFAVWIRYRIKVFDDEGDQVANWPVSAYGKSQKASMSGTQALQRAAILAMRDAAALMIMKLDEATGITKIAEAKSAMALQSPPVMTEELENAAE
ncbi:MAG: hypothetical protein ACR2QS_07040 [Woeseiaceae bacterium]